MVCLTENYGRLNSLTELARDSMSIVQKLKQICFVLQPIVDFTPCRTHSITLLGKLSWEPSRSTLGNLYLVYVVSAHFSTSNVWHFPDTSLRGACADRSVWIKLCLKRFRRGGRQGQETVPVGRLFQIKKKKRFYKCIHNHANHGRLQILSV